MSQQRNLPLCSKVFILNPNVGEIVSIGSPLNLLRIVVLPALSNPLFFFDLFIKLGKIFTHDFYFIILTAIKFSFPFPFDASFLIL